MIDSAVGQNSKNRAQHSRQSRSALQIEALKIYIDMVNSHTIDGARHATSGQRMEATDKDEPAE
jgi:hypothetical protein